MLEDKILVLKFKCGNSQALEQIYQKYKVELLSLATAMTHDRDLAEDVLHDVFVSFANAAKGLQLRASLRRYLTTAVANRVRNIRRSEHRGTRDFGNLEHIAADNDMRPEKMAMTVEEFEFVQRALAELPELQREAVALRLHSDVPFKAIARLQGVTTSTVQARYRYGLDKLRSLLDGKARQ